MELPVCHKGTLRVSICCAVAVFLAVPAGFAQTAPAWRKVGSASVDLQLAGPATGPVDQVWFAPGGGVLYARAASPEISRALRERIVWWENYTKINGMEMNNNPSPGNKAGGLTTILEKSLGAVAKAGTSPLNEVIEYAKPITKHGFVFMDSPGLDPCSATGQVASGANLIAFTTGRGSAYGCKPTPSIKLATNTAMYQRMTEDMDINCGTIATGEASVAEKGAEILTYMLDVASGKKTKSEELGYGDLEFVPWHIGAVM